MSAPGYRLVIFDFDGTLADSFPWFSRVFNDIADRYRFRRIAPDEAQRLRGLTTRELMRDLGIPSWKIPFIANHMRQRVARDIDAIHLFDGVGAMLSRLSAIKSPLIREVRGRGLFAGVEIDARHADAHDVALRLIRAGVLTKDTHRNTIRFAPPLTIDEAEIDWSTDRLAEVLKETAAAPAA